MKKTIFVFFLLFPILLKGQNTSQTNTNTGGHFEFSLKITGGLNMPLFNRKNGGEESLTVLQKGGDFNSVAFQAALAGRKNFSLLMEVGYGTSFNSISYSLEDQGVSHDMTDIGKYSMRIKKEEFALMAKHYLTAHRICYIDYGLYLAAEDQKIINGTVQHSGSYYNPNYNPGPSTTGGTTYYESTDIYDNKHVIVTEQIGLVQGIGWNIPFKNKSSVFIDLRLNVHDVSSPARDIFFKVVDLGLSVGYTFYKTKSHTRTQNSPTTENIKDRFN